LKLHQNKGLFQDAVLSASQRFGIPEIYIDTLKKIEKRMKPLSWGI
jgi:hypothetical protein